MILTTPRGEASPRSAACSSSSGGGVRGSCLGMAAFWLVNYVLVATAVSLTSQRPFRSLVTSSAL